MMECFFLQQLTPHSRCLSREIKVLANRLTSDRSIAAKGVVIEGIPGFVQLQAQAIVGVVEVEHLAIATFTPSESAEWVVLLEHGLRARLAVSISWEGGVEAEERHLCCLVSQ
jgi:hypothetical protein